jgi:pimeloyl-ACP methyl ester carboxylesterase
MPRLARTFTVVAVDLRGVGGSAATPGGYDAVSLAEDIRQLAGHLGLERAFVGGHDNGGMVAYALARVHPQSTRGVMILDVPIPGLAPWEQVKADPTLWHFGFHQTPNVPERLIAGREAIYFREVFFNRFSRNPAAISEQDLLHYVGSYASTDQLRAGLEVTARMPQMNGLTRTNGAQSMCPSCWRVATTRRHRSTPPLPNHCAPTGGATCQSRSLRTVGTRSSMSSLRPSRTFSSDMGHGRPSRTCAALNARTRRRTSRHFR